jgi:hypothetical protein
MASDDTPFPLKMLDQFRYVMRVISYASKPATGRFSMAWQIDCGHFMTG